MMPLTAFQLIRMRFDTPRMLASPSHAVTSSSNAAVRGSPVRLATRTRAPLSTGPSSTPFTSQPGPNAIKLSTHLRISILASSVHGSCRP